MGENRAKDGNYFLRLKGEVVVASEVYLYYIEQGMPDVFRSSAPEQKANLMAAILENRLTCWAVVTQEGDNTILQGLFTTAFSENPITGDKVICLTSIVSIRGLSLSMYKEGLAEVLKYAGARGVKKLVAYTKDSQIAKLAGSFGGVVTAVISIEGR